MKALLPAFALLLAACAQSTQITFDLSTDVPCQEIESVGLSVGPVGSVETKAPVTTTTSCSPSGTLSAIGTYAVVPAAGPVEVSVRVTLAEKGVSLENECTAENKYKGCIVARRDITFIPRRGLVVPIKLLLVCRDVGCDVNTTCNRLGRCVSSKIEPNKCNGDLCEETVDPFPTGNSSTPAASPRQSTWVASPDRAAADGIATVGLTLTLRDGEGKPIVNERVSVSASGSNNLWSIPTSTTNDAGIFLARLASTSAEQKTLTVSTTDVDLETQVTFGGAVSPDGGSRDAGDGGNGGPVDGGDGGLPAWAQQAYVKASNTGPNDGFGTAIALSADGDTLAIGADGEDSDTRGINPPAPNTSAPNSGAVYVYRRTGGTWAQEAYIKASNADPGDQFGSALSLSSDGSTLAVGAFVEASNATGSGGNQTNNAFSVAGAVYVFVRSGTTWSQQEYVKASNTEAGDNFGRAVSLSGDGETLAVGATGEDSSANTINGSQTNNLAGFAGAVYVFTRTGTAWQQQAYIKASNPEGLDQFGFSVGVSFDGNTLVVGAPGEGSSSVGIDGDQGNNAAPLSGAAYVFHRVGASWAQISYLKPSNTRELHEFGTIVSISGDGATIVVGAPGENGNAAGINGEQMSVNGAQSGAVYLYRKAGTAWTQEAYVKASNTDLGDRFGGSTALSRDGKTLMVGAIQEAGQATGLNGDESNNNASGAGAGYVFRRGSANWTQASYAKASNAEANDRFGKSVAVSEDGFTFAIGAYYEDSSAVGIDGDQMNNSLSNPGAVYVYSARKP